MDTIKKILAPTDLSELSQAGVRYALDLAKGVGAEVTVYHVVNYDELIHYGDAIKGIVAIDHDFVPPASVLERYQRALTKFLKDHFSDLAPWPAIREKVELGRPHENIVERAKEDGADLIVISTHGRSGLAHMFLGSVTEKVVRSAPCPVLSIHPSHGAKQEQRAAANG